MDLILSTAADSATRDDRGTLASSGNRSPQNPSASFADDRAVGHCGLREAHAIVRDLFVPLPKAYWRELAVYGPVAWAATAIAVAADGFPVPAAAAVVLAALAWHRATVMVHELTHQRRAEIPGFHLAWNLAVGVAWLFPSVMYERVHDAHHRKSTYGTAADPEYLPLAGRPWLVAAYLLSGLVLFPLLFLRFLVLAPVSWAIPALRRFILRHGSSYTINPWFSRSTTRAERRRMLAWEIVILGAWLPPVALTAAGVLSWRWLACWYAIHTGATVLNRVRMLAAHRFASGGSRTDHLGQFADSVDHPGGWWTVLFAPLGLQYHALHHLFPTLPFHNLREAYDRLTAGLPAGAFYSASSSRGYLTTIRTTLTTRPPAVVLMDRPPPGVG
jgi:fatty acid desaturase